MSKNQKKQHLNQASSKKKTPQKSNKKVDDHKKDVREIEKSCERLVLMLSEQGTIAVYIFDLLYQFAYSDTDTAETNPDKLNKLLQGVRYLNKFRRETFARILQLSQFKLRIRELYSIMKREDFFSAEFENVAREVQLFMNTSMDILGSLREFWNLYKIELMNSQVPEKFVVNIMSSLKLPKEEISAYINMKQKEIEQAKPLDTSELFKDDNTEVKPDDNVKPVKEIRSGLCRVVE